MTLTTCPPPTAPDTGDRTRTPRRLAATATVLRTLARHAWFVEDEVPGLDDLVQPGDTCLDIGAEYGLYTLALAACCGPTGRVHSVEPHPGAHRILRRAVSAAGAGGCVRTHNHALGLRDQRAWMSVPRRAGLPVHGRGFVTADTIDPGPNATEFSTARWLPVDVTTLDAFCVRESIERLDFVKADVEGAELQVLRGGVQTLTRHRPVLQLEIQQPHIAKYDASADDLLDLLCSLGYTMRSWRDGRWRSAAAVTPARRNYLFTP